MERAKLLTVLMVGTITLTAQVPRSAPASVDPQEAVLGRHLETVNLKHVTTTEVLETILHGTGIPGGIVVLQGKMERPKYSFLTPGGWTLRQVLSYLTSVVPYRWQLSEGAVNLFPEGKIPPLLRLIISDFDFEDVSNRSLLEQQLQERPEIRDRAAELGLEWATLQTGLGVYMPPGEKASPPRSVHLKNVTLLEALNAIARARGGGVWTYTEQVERGQTYIGISF